MIDPCKCISRKFVLGESQVNIASNIFALQGADDGVSHPLVVESLVADIWAGRIT
jgi:hypothetical protein